jgi:hypothetical protein
MNSFPSDFQSNLTGFGGDPSKNQEQHKAGIKRTPVILVHGNSTNSADPKFGMLQLKRFLMDPSIGYQPSEIWAMDYLGENNTTVDMGNGVHRRHIDVFRTFIDKVRTYLGVEKLDIIAHSLGCTMTEGYLRGLRSDGGWDNSNDRFDSVSTVVCLAGALHGIARGGIDEFDPASDFIKRSHVFSGVEDETPFGEDSVSDQIAPVNSWKKVSRLDNDSIQYVAFTAANDFIDGQNRDTGRKEGADINKRFNLGTFITGHEKIVKDQAVFDEFKGLLNKSPPMAPVKVSVDKESGKHESALAVSVTVNPVIIPVRYTAKRLTKSIPMGFIVETVAETKTGALSNGESLTLSPDGAWDVVFSVDGAEDIARTYGVNTDIPIVTILTGNETPFQGSLEVKTRTTKGVTFFSQDGQHWNAEANPTITETGKTHFIAIDPSGLASPIVSRSFEKKVVISATGTLSEHFVAGRLTSGEFVKLGLQLGFTAVVTLFFINDKWVLNPETQEVAARAPMVSLSVQPGVFDKPITVAVKARHDVDAAPKVYFTLDGSLPDASSPSFAGAGLIDLNTPGDKTIKLRAMDAAGNWSDVRTETYTMNVSETSPRITADVPDGEYPESFNVVISASDDADSKVTVYYTTDGADPSDMNNPKRHSFVDSKQFKIEGNGPHSIFCYAKDSDGNEMSRPFVWSIDDQRYPETSLSPSMGGLYVESVDVVLSPSERCEWTKYTTDNSEPSDTNGKVYAGPISVLETTTLKFRSKDVAGNLEPVKTAVFTIVPQLQEVIFNNNADRDGYTKAAADGSDAFVGSYRNLAIGAGRDGKENRAILYFDTSSLPDNAEVSSARLEIKVHAKKGDVWADGRTVEVDIQHGCFGSSQAIQADDWDAPATAEGVARIDKSGADVIRSTDFSQAGIDAINKTGPTQVRLRMNRPHTSADNYVFLKGGAEARLLVEYSGGVARG